MPFPVGSTVLVTGAAGAIGAAIVRRLAADGMRVIGLDARPPPGSDQLQIDLTAPGAAAAIAAHGPFDFLVAAAGVGYYSVVEVGEPEAVRRLFDVNVLGNLASIQAVLPAMRERRRGTIVVMSSMAGRMTWPAGGFYAASKAALESLAEALHFETAAFGIRVVIVEPGSFASDFMTRAERTAAPDPYAPVLDAFEGAAARLFVRGQDPSLIADAIADALAGDSLFARVPVGIDAERELAALEGSSRAEFLRRWTEIYGSRGPDRSGA